jgi:hypothetical protein
MEYVDDPSLAHLAISLTSVISKVGPKRADLRAAFCLDNGTKCWLADVPRIKKSQITSYRPSGSLRVCSVVRQKDDIKAGSKLLGPIHHLVEEILIGEQLEATTRQPLSKRCLFPMALWNLFIET